MNAHFTHATSIASRLLALALLCQLAACAAADESDAASAGQADLIAHDPLRHTYDFLRGDYGAEIQNNEVRNAGSHIDFSNYFEGEIAVGIQGHERGILVDLGTDEQVAAKLGVTETAGLGQGFAHLALTNGRFPFAEANVVLDTELDSTGHLQPQVGHVYLARIGDPDEGEGVLVKMLVVHLEQSENLIFEWARL